MVRVDTSRSLAKELPRTALTLALIVLWMTLGGSCAAAIEPQDADEPVSAGDSGSVPVYSYRVVNTYPHDRNAFTQGLAFDEGNLYEGTGRRGSSSLRQVDLETGVVQRVTELPERFLVKAQPFLVIGSFS